MPVFIVVLSPRLRAENLSTCRTHEPLSKKRRPDFSERREVHQNPNRSPSFSLSALGFALSYAFFFAFSAFKAKVSLDL